MRVNQRENEKRDFFHPIKHIHRQQDSNRSGKQKINVMSDNILIKSFDTKISTNTESISNLSHLRYIKSPTNTEIEGQIHKVENLRDCDKYLKINYNPILSN